MTVTAAMDMPSGLLGWQRDSRRSIKVVLNGPHLSTSINFQQQCKSRASHMSFCSIDVQHAGPSASPANDSGLVVLAAGRFLFWAYLLPCTAQHLAGG
jgi:hypothetical protein